MTTTLHEHTHTAAPQSKEHDDCACKEPKTSTCCSLLCFERPNYFCGHLLTDADLSLGQKYLIEKQKLYHRTLDGWGVVCGLRLTCDHECAGYIRAGEGYAIDDCGNDLVVCETQKVNVIGILREKGYLIAEPPLDPCRPAPPRDDCPVRQCFFITACYDEEPGDFTTPFRTGCGSGPAECEPTRIRERVRFDVLAEAPPQTNILDSVQQRVEACLSALTTGIIGKKLKEHEDDYLKMLEPVEVEKACEKFCELRVTFLQHLRRCPDAYNCETEKIVRDLSCPDSNSTTFRNDMKSALSTLLEQIHEYFAACVANEAIVPCPSSSKACCVLLGTVEVENGSIRRVCNVPRRNLWTPANLIPNAMFHLLTGRLRQPKKMKEMSVLQQARFDERYYSDYAAPGQPPVEHHEKRCCPDYNESFDAKGFVRGHKVSAFFTQYKATSPMTAMRAMLGALYRGFDYTNSSLASLRMVGEKNSAQTAREAGFRARVAESGAQVAPNPLQAFARNMLQPQDYPGLIYTDHADFEWFSPDYIESANLDLRATEDVGKHVLDMATAQIDAKFAEFGGGTQAAVRDLRMKIEQLSRELETLKNNVTNVPNRPADDDAPASPPAPPLPVPPPPVDPNTPGRTARKGRK